MEGDSVTLHTNVTEINIVDQLEWTFIPQETLIALIDKEISGTPIYGNIVLDGRFRDRVKVDYQTGDLIITNITAQHTGLYQMTFISKLKISNRFTITVYGPLPIPDISKVSSQCSSSSERSSDSKCVLLCSVLSMTDVILSLSWYKGNSLLSSINVSDLNIRLSLPLEVEYQDNNTYRCVVNNPLINQTQHLIITDVCEPCSDFVNSCALTEAVIRLVVSALVGVAAVAASVVLIYDIRSRRDEQKRRS
ncbi:uncharacterized protein [Paramisgurnus dabryanus]|uniref:uncharacterized protein n=1 Tax=Paramisgurnus dabryanus TaxID=90735 RepID=UPI0031F4687B